MQNRSKIETLIKLVLKNVAVALVVLGVGYLQMGDNIWVFNGPITLVFAILISCIATYKSPRATTWNGVFVAFVFSILIMASQIFYTVSHYDLGQGGGVGVMIIGGELVVTIVVGCIIGIVYGIRS